MKETAQQEVASLFSTAQKRILIVVIAGLFIIFSIVFLLLTLAQKGKDSSQQAVVTPTSVPLRSLEQKAKMAPVVSFAQYTNQAVLPSLPPSLKTYTLKANFSLEEVKQFAKQFGLDKYKPTNQKEIVFYSEQKNTRGYMVFNKETGIFSFQSWGILTPTTRGTTPQTTALSFLKQVGIADNTLSCSITYKRKILANDHTFVECHRMPDKLGTILVNPAGILNLSENISLSSLKVGYAGSNSPIDKDIYNTSIREDGKARPNDFNTITIGVFQDGRIFSVDSTMRWIKETAPITTILSPQEALDNFRQQKATFSLTIPAGQGVVNWDTVYPKNKAEAQEATITDYKLVYLEKPPTAIQASYEPYYLIRGTARLKSGYMVRFVQTVPATTNTNVLGTSNTKQLAALQIKPYYPPTNTPVPTRTPTPTTNPAIPTNTPTPPRTTTSIPTQPLNPTATIAPIPTEAASTQVCTIPVQGIDIVLQVPAYGTFVVVFAESSENSAFHVKSTQSSNTDINTIINAFYKAVEDQYVVNVAQWILKHKDIVLSFTKSQEKEGVHKIIDAMSGYYSFSASEDWVEWNRPGPPSRRDAKSSAGPVYRSQIEQVRNSVVDRINTAIQEEKLEEIAARDDIFPTVSIYGSPVQVLGVEPFYIAQGRWYYEPGTTLAEAEDCYIAGTGQSPAIFLYTPVNSVIRIVNVNAIYADPLLINSMWNISAIYQKQDFLVSNVLRNYLYYEYDGSKVQFREPKEGYVVKKDEWKKIAETIALQVGINDKEKQALFTDIQNALPKVQTPYMKISIVNEKEIAEKLPLTISPTPDTIRRIHLLLTPQRATSKPAAPVLSPIVRNGFTVVEVGVAVEK